ncbi:tryptophan synthase subunit alpha [Syntrophaceticus schinkii]
MAPTTTPKRLEKISGAAQGSVYCVSLTGVTG